LNKINRIKISFTAIVIFFILLYEIMIVLVIVTDYLPLYVILKNMKKLILKNLLVEI